MTGYSSRRRWPALLAMVWVPGIVLNFQAGYGEDTAPERFQAGVYAVDITPTEFPVITNGYFTERQETRAIDRLMSRAWVLDDGQTRLAVAVVDNLMIPRPLLDEVRQMVTHSMGIPEDHILISATHTHTAPSVMACLGSRADERYTRYLPGRIAKSIEMAARSMVPVEIGWAAVQDHDHNHCRRWIFRPDHVQKDPFGSRTVRANMHPGYLSPRHIGPAGPVDPDFSIVALRTADGRLLSVLGNYAMHYFGSTAISADACGRFGDHLAALLPDARKHPSFVGILSQGTSGDSHGGRDYSRPKRTMSLDEYTQELAQTAMRALQQVSWHSWVPLRTAETHLVLQRRVPDERRLAWARKRMEDLGDGRLESQADIYAWEQICLHNEPQVELRLQVLAIGELGIAALPNEVYGLTGLKLKERSPFELSFNIELANGAFGYIPPPEQHDLGGYTTWPARTAGLEVQAEPQIVETILQLMERLTGRPRRTPVPAESPWTQAVRQSRPEAWWRFEEMEGTQARDVFGRHHGRYEAGTARWLPGPNAPGITAGRRGNHAAHFAGGRMVCENLHFDEDCSVECWFWNGLPHDARPVTGIIWSIGHDGDSTATGDHLGIGGTQEPAAAGKLVFFSGSEPNHFLTGTTLLSPRTWNHVVFVRQGHQVSIYLNGRTTPEISGEATWNRKESQPRFFVGGRCDRFAGLEGRVDEVAIYRRALTPDEIARHYHLAIDAAVSAVPLSTPLLPGKSRASQSPIRPASRTSPGEQADQF